MTSVYFKNNESLIEPALAAGMNVPANVDKYEHRYFKHFNTFCNVQLNRSMPNIECVWHNARVITKLSDTELGNLTWPFLQEKGFIRV